MKNNNNLNAENSERFVQGAKSQAPSLKRQAQKGTSHKLQGPSAKAQASSPSYKIPDHGPLVKFNGPRTEGLNADEAIVWMRNMIGNLMR